jgi:hypothetical protein
MESKGQCHAETEKELEGPPLHTKGSQIASVALYFVLNLALTFYNKSLLNGFPFPYLMTAMHAASAVIGCASLKALGFTGLETGKGDSAETVRLLGEGDTKARASHNGSSPVVLLYSTLYAANIAISNASLGLVSVPFHQIIRSTCPVFTLALGLVLLARKPHLMAVCALVPIVGGAIMACLGELSFTSYGFLLTVLGTVLAGVKTVVTHLLQVNKAAAKTAESRWSLIRFEFTPVQLLQVMSPLACIQCLFASYITGELQRATRQLFPFRYGHLLLLAGNGALAFALNIVSFQTNRAAGPLTMTVVGNAKQVTTILLAIQLYGVQLGLVNIIGVAIALSGTAWYGVMEMRRRS